MCIITNILTVFSHILQVKFCCLKCSKDTLRNGRLMGIHLFAVCIYITKLHIKKQSNCTTHTYISQGCKQVFLTYCCSCNNLLGSNILGLSVVNIFANTVASNILHGKNNKSNLYIIGVFNFKRLSNSLLLKPTSFKISSLHWRDTMIHYCLTLLST